MKTTPLHCLGAFVVGVFVGSRLWVALLLCAAFVVVWWQRRPRSDIRLR